jgi:hypothetical protein
MLLASSYDQSRFLKAADLEKEKKFRIKGATEELIGAEQKEEKLVIWFTNDKRGLVLNKTNNRTIRGAFGDPVGGWVGKIIIIFPTVVDMRGKLTPALRVRIPPPKQTAAAPPTPKPAPSGNGATAAAEPPTQQAAAPTVGDPELEDDPVKPLRDDLDDEVGF